jgi:hypothetical protein
VNERQINREFFVGHKSPIIFIAHIENGKDMVTVDEAGHIFIWKYNKEFLSEDGVFEPETRYRVSLNYQRFERIASKLLNT